MITRIVFFGTPAFAVPFLNAISHDSKFEVVAVVTQPDKPVGRKQILTKPEIKIAAEAMSIPVFQFQTLKNSKAEETLRTLDADLFVVVAYGKLIPRAILDVPRKGCMNVHPSLLPKYRGPSPMQYAILNGDTTSGISIMLLDEGMDTGPILAQTSIQLDAHETFTTLEKKILSEAPSLLVDTIHGYLAQTIQLIAQDDSHASVTKLLERVDGEIDWSNSAQSIDQKIRAFETWPGTWFTWNENVERVRIAIKRAQLTDHISNKPAGTRIVESNRVLVVCGDSRTIELIEIQPEGKNNMSPIEYARGHKNF